MTLLPWLVGATVVCGAMLMAVEEVVTAGVVGALMGAAGVVDAVFLIVTGTALWVWMLELTFAV